MLAIKKTGIVTAIALLVILALTVWAQTANAQEDTDIPAPAVTVEAPVNEAPVVVVEPSRSPVSYEAILMFIGAVIAGLIWFANQSNQRVERSVPVELALILGDALVKLTPTTTDDELLARLKLLFTPEVERAVEKAVNDTTEAVG